MSAARRMWPVGDSYVVLPLWAFAELLQQVGSLTDPMSGGQPGVTP